LPPDVDAHKARKFYSRIADAVETILGVRAFAPHEHSDPLTMTAAQKKENVYEFCSDIVRNKTSLLIVVALGPSWGGGGECQIAADAYIPIVVLIEKGKRVSDYILDMPVIRAVIEYQIEEEGMALLAEQLMIMKNNNEI